MRAKMPTTPLRYPGGKQKLAPFIRELIEVNDLRGCEYVEPYAGGAGVALELLVANVVSKIHLNDSCRAVYAFWKSVRDESEKFARRIFTVDLSVEEWRRQRAIYLLGSQADRFDLGFSFFYLNRCNRSGILNAGPIGGHDQAGKWKIDARFSRRELARRIELIAALGKRIQIRNWDAESFVNSHVAKLPKSTLIYFDPPYFQKADRLYANHYESEDHKRIAEIVRSLKKNWVVSYDSNSSISRFYRDESYIVYDLQYNAGPVRKGQEVFYFSPLLKIPAASTVTFVNESLLRPSTRRRLRAVLETNTPV